MLLFCSRRNGLVNLGRCRRHDEPGIVKVACHETAPENRNPGPHDIFVDAGSHHDHVGPNRLQLPQFGGSNRSSTDEQHAAAGKGHEDREKISHNKKGPESSEPPGLVINNLEKGLTDGEALTAQATTSTGALPVVEHS